MKIYYNEKLKLRASRLRCFHRTYAERMLWHCLRNRQIGGYKFMRQKPIGNFITDFFCLELKLVIEVDGISHEDKDIIKYDQKRQKYLEEKGFTVIRFISAEAFSDLQDIAKKITEVCKSLESK